MYVDERKLLHICMRVQFGRGDGRACVSQGGNSSSDAMMYIRAAGSSVCSPCSAGKFNGSTGSYSVFRVEVCSIMSCMFNLAIHKNRLPAVSVGRPGHGICRPAGSRYPSAGRGTVSVGIIHKIHACTRTTNDFKSSTQWLRRILSLAV